MSHFPDIAYKEVQTELGKCTEFSFCILVYSLKIIHHFARKVVYNTTFPTGAPYQIGIKYHISWKSGTKLGNYTTQKNLGNKSKCGH